MTIKKTGLALILGYLSLLAYIALFQRGFLYLPQHPYTPLGIAIAHERFQEISVQTEDGLTLKGWHAPATKEKPTIVYFHGNADSLQTAAPLADPYIEAGYGYLIAEYRGYSDQEGSPTERGLYADGRAFINGLIGSGLSEGSLVLFGHSLGTGVATQMATEFSVRGLLLIAPFVSIAEMAQVRFPYIPAKQLTWDRYENIRKLPQIKTPLLIATGGRDIVVPPAHGRALFAAANEPKRFYFSPESGHNDLFDADLYSISFAWLKTLDRKPEKTSERPAPAEPEAAFSAEERY